MTIGQNSTVVPARTDAVGAADVSDAAGAAGFEPLRRIAAYGVCRDDQSRTLLVRASAATGTPGAWSLPGGAVAHGEHPYDTVVRETAAETGLSVSVARLLDVVADLRALPVHRIALHTDRLIYEVRVRGGALRDRVDQPTDLARWVTAGELSDLPLRAFTAAALGLTAPPEEFPEESPGLPSFHVVPGPDGLHRTQRFAAYALATDPRGRLLLTLIADGYPGAGQWHLPGGGTDYGEQPAAALIRELVEETGQNGRLVSLVGVASHRDAASLGPEGFPIDWHGVRAFYRVMVDRPTRPKVVDAGGSTAQARWFRPGEIGRLPVTEVTSEALAQARL
jgi:ADP-ribose pyrophosphatase YjhB (NUDIX family)